MIVPLLTIHALYPLIWEGILASGRVIGDPSLAGVPSDHHIVTETQFDIGGLVIRCFTELIVIELCSRMVKNVNNSYDDRLFFALLVTGFFGLLRVGELTDPNNPRLINRETTIRRDSLTLTQHSASFVLPASKTDKVLTEHKVSVHSNKSSNDPVTAITLYVELRDQRFKDSPWLWVTSDGEPPTRRWFISRLQRHLCTNVGGYSMRAGGAAVLAKHGMNFDVIQDIGRWPDDAFRNYISKHPLLLDYYITSQKT